MSGAALALPARWARMAADTGKPFGQGGAYSSDCFADWPGCVALLRQRGATLAGAETVLRSKHMRWCSDESHEPYGHATVEHFANYLDTSPDARAMAGITDGPTGEHPTKAALDVAQSAGTRFASAMMAALDAMPDDARHAAARVALRSRIQALTLAINLGAVIDALPARTTRAKGARE